MASALISIGVLLAGSIQLWVFGGRPKGLPESPDPFLMQKVVYSLAIDVDTIAHDPLW